MQGVGGLYKLGILQDDTYLENFVLVDTPYLRPMTLYFEEVFLPFNLSPLIQTDQEVVISRMRCED